MKYKGSKLEEYINSKVYSDYLSIDLHHDSSTGELSWITFIHKKYGEFRYIISGSYIRYYEKSNIIFKNIDITADLLLEFLTGKNKKLLYIFFNAYLSIKYCKNIGGEIFIDFKENIVFNRLNYSNKIKLPYKIDVDLIMKTEILQEREYKNDFIHILKNPDCNVYSLGFNKKSIDIFNDYNKLEIDGNEFLKDYKYVKPIGEINAKSAPVGFFTYYVFYMLKVKNNKKNHANIKIFIYLYRLLFKNYYRKLETVAELDVHNNEVIIADINKKLVSLVENRLLKNGY